MRGHRGTLSCVEWLGWGPVPPSLPATNAKRLRKGAKRRSNPSLRVRRYGLLRSARNDDVDAAKIVGWVERSETHHLLLRQSTPAAADLLRAQALFHVATATNWHDGQISKTLSSP